MDAISPQTATDPTQTLIRSVRRIAQAIDVRSREIARTTGLTLPQLLVLQAIRALGEVSTGAISREVSMSPPTVVAVLDRLEARGLIVRYRSTADRRIVHARLTDQGHEALTTVPDLLGTRTLVRWSAMPAPQQHSLAEALDLLADLLASPPTSGEPGDDRPR